MLSNRSFDSDARGAGARQAGRWAFLIGVTKGVTLVK
jgi:hypothetical protein